MNKAYAASITKSQQLSPFFQFGRQARTGFNVAANGGYDFVNGALQYAGSRPSITGTAAA